MYNLESPNPNPALRRMPGAGSAKASSDFVAKRIDSPLCHSCVNYVPKQTLLTGRGIAGRCDVVCPGSYHILVRA
jgi:hypothetical protein